MYVLRSITKTRLRAGLGWLFVLLLLPSGVRAQQMSSTNYIIPWDTVSSGGDEGGASTNYRLADTIGGQGLGTGTSTNYRVEPGYRAGDERPLGFEIALGDPSEGSYAYSAVSFSNKTFTVTDPSSATKFTPGGYVGLKQNPGLSQLLAVGKVVSVVGSVITVDRFDGDTGSMSANPTAETAYATRLNMNTIAFGEITVAAGVSATGMASVVADTDGYTLYIQADGPPTSGANSINPVPDSVVSAGSEEYGVQSMGTTAQMPSDKGVSTDALAIQSSSTSTANPADRIGFMYKLAISSSTPSGTYAQSLFFTLTPHY